MSYLTQVLEQAAAIGGPVDDVLDPARAFRRRADELNARLDEVRSAHERQHGAVVSAFAEGREADLAVAAQHAAAAAAWAYDSPAAKLVVEAVAECHRRAEHAMPGLAPRLFEQLQATCAAVVDESVKLTAKLPFGIAGVEDVLRAGPEPAAAWQRLTRLNDAFLELHALADTLRNSGWVDGPPHKGGGFDRPWIRTRFRHPERLSKAWGTQPAQVLLGTATAAGAEPGLYSWEEARRLEIRFGVQAGIDPGASYGYRTPEPEPLQEPMTALELDQQWPIIVAAAEAGVQHIPAPGVS